MASFEHMNPGFEATPAAPIPHSIGGRRYEISPSFRHDMAVPAVVFADRELLQAIQRDRSLLQLVNVTTLPGIVGAAYGMPDIHEGYGFPVGGVAATLLPDGVISPGGIGFDINCGVRLLVTEITREEFASVATPLVHDLSRSVPAGVGRGSRELSLDDAQLERLLEQGASWLVDELGIGTVDDLDFIESGGRLMGARADGISQRARQRGHGQLGTLGGGNHFLEVQVVGQLFDEEAARALGLFENQITVLIHTGSRGLGHQTCTDWLKVMDSAMPRYGIQVPDRQLSCAPLSSKEGQGYFASMAAAANFAFGNRHVIAERCRRVFERFFGESKGRLKVVYDVGHNTAKIERHGEELLCVHRKGATRAFGPSNEEIPEAYRGVGQPVFVPGSMGTSSHVLVGTDAAMDLSFGSCCHGAGRAMSRSASKRQVHGATLRRSLEAQGIVVRSPSNAELAEEAPSAYKDVDHVVDVVESAGLARKVARLLPLGVVKG